MSDLPLPSTPVFQNFEVKKGENLPLECCSLFAVSGFLRSPTGGAPGREENSFCV